MTSVDERIAILETKTDNQELRIKELETNKEAMMELTYNVKTITSKLDSFIDTQSQTNDKLSEAIDILKNKTQQLEEAPKNIVYNTFKTFIKGILPKVLPWIIITGYAIYKFVTSNLQSKL